MESTTTHRYEPMSVDKSSDSFMHEGESTAVVRTSFVHFILLVSMITAKRWSEFLRRSCTLQNRDFRTGSTPDEAKPACSWKTPRIASYAVLGAFWKDAFAMMNSQAMEACFAAVRIAVLSRRSTGNHDSMYEAWFSISACNPISDCTNALAISATRSSSA